jgi:hypothetical protein
VCGLKLTCESYDNDNDDTRQGPSTRLMSRAAPTTRWDGGVGSSGVLTIGRGKLAMPKSCAAEDSRAGGFTNEEWCRWVCGGYSDRGEGE